MISRLGVGEIESGAPARVTGRGVRFVRRLPRAVVVGVLRGYQLIISPWYAPSCKYYPSCSTYAVQAVEHHGVFRGAWLALRRLARCHPWAAGGVDDVPHEYPHRHLSRPPTTRPPDRREGVPIT